MKDGGRKRAYMYVTIRIRLYSKLKNTSNLKDSTYKKSNI